MKSFKLIPLSFLLSSVIFQTPLHAQNQQPSTMDRQNQTPSSRMDTQNQQTSKMDAQDQQTSRIDTLTGETITDKRTPKRLQITPAQDALIAKRLDSMIKGSPTLSKLEIKTISNNGVVTISGTAESRSQVLALVELAQTIYGVKDVKTKNLKVRKSNHPFEDSLITAKIRGLFIQQDIFGKGDIPSINISVETKNGKVFLTGVVKNQEQIDNAMKIIRNVKGVKAVEFHIDRLIIPRDSKSTKQ